MGLYIHVLLAEANNHCGAIPEMGIRQLFYAILILISGSFSDCQLQLFFFTQSLDITGIVAWACRSVTATSGPRRARPWNQFWWAHNTTLRLWIFFPIFLQWTKIFWLFHTAWAYILYQFYLTPASLNIPFFFDQNTTSPIRTPCFGLHHAAPPRLDTPGTQKWPHHVHLLFSPTFQSWKVMESHLETSWIFEPGEVTRGLEWKTTLRSGRWFQPSLAVQCFWSAGFDFSIKRLAQSKSNLGFAMFVLK